MTSWENATGGRTSHPSRGETSFENPICQIAEKGGDYAHTKVHL